jgi:hypothetical protein
MCRVSFQPSRPSFAAAAPRGLHHVGGNARELRRIGDEQPEVVGRVQHVVLETRAQLRQLLLHGEEARLLRGRQLRASQAEIAQHVLHVALARRRERGECRRGAQRLEAGVEARVLALLAEELRDLGQRRGVRIAQRRRIHHDIQVAHLRPGVATGGSFAASSSGSVSEALPVASFTVARRSWLASLGDELVHGGATSPARFAGNAKAG